VQVTVGDAGVDEFTHAVGAELVAIDDAMAKGAAVARVLQI
jgi:hypothetical protein